MILIVDNYDSFTYNLVQLVSRHTRDITILRNDRFTLSDIDRLGPSRILISPGPGRPEDAGICVELIRTKGSSIPMLGVCLGHQAIGYAFGGSIIHAPTLMHGKTSVIEHDGNSIFKDIPQSFNATRYHSLAVEEASLPNELIVTARTADNVVMGIRHSHFPIEGIQFHPESILTEHGELLIANWLENKPL